MKPFSERLNRFIKDWYSLNCEKFRVYDKSQFDFTNIEDTFKRFTKHYKQHNSIPIWYDDNEDNIFGDIKINGKFRAWHDYFHILLNADFTLEGEKKVYEHQQALLPKDWGFERKLMYCEIVKQAEHYSSGGKTIKDQRLFTKNYLGMITENKVIDEIVKMSMQERFNTCAKTLLLLNLTMDELNSIVNVLANSQKRIKDEQNNI